MKATHVDALDELASNMARDGQPLREQLREVQDHYPKVMLAYRIQQALIAELSAPRSIGDTRIGRLYAAIEKVPIDDFSELTAENQERLEDLRLCLQRSHTSDASSGEQYLAGVAC